MKRLYQILSLITCILLVMAASIRRDGRILGHDLQPSDETTVTVSSDTLRKLPDGTMVINTTLLGQDIVGYGGRVPLEISIKDGIVTHVEALENAETPRFFEKTSPLLTKWDGLTIEQAQALKVDAVTGATYTSKAIIGNMERGLSFAANNSQKKSFWSSLDVSAKAIFGLIVALMAAIIPLFVKSPRYRIVQQVLNIAVLGFWCGTFLNYTALIGYMSNGMNIAAMLVPIILLITALIYPLFGKKSYYCTNVCPFGALQELAGKCVKYKIPMSAKTVRWFDLLRKILWAVLMLCLWTGVWFDWIDYEPFSAFVVQSASWVVIVIALVFVALSTIIMRPYCRFVCPTGTLLKISQSTITDNNPKQ